MTGATVPTALYWPPAQNLYFPSGDVIINGSYKSFIRTATSSKDEVEIALF